MKIMIFFCGIYSVAFAIFHALFWRIFQWKVTLKQLNFSNKAIIQILNCRLIYFFLLIGFICFAYPDELLHSVLVDVLLAGVALFWAGRTIEQFIFLKTLKDWRVHLLTIIFLVGFILFGLPLVIN